MLTQEGNCCSLHYMHAVSGLCILWNVPWCSTAFMSAALIPQKLKQITSEKPTGITLFRAYMLVRGDTVKSYITHQINTLFSFTDVLYEVPLERLNTALLVYLQPHPQGLWNVQT